MYNSRLDGISSFILDIVPSFIACKLIGLTDITRNCVFCIQVASGKRIAVRWSRGMILA